MVSHSKFEFFDVTADVGYRAYGKTMNDAFSNAALALFEVMTDTSNIKPLMEQFSQVIANGNQEKEQGPFVQMISK